MVERVQRGALSRSLISASTASNNDTSWSRHGRIATAASWRSSAVAQCRTLHEDFRDLTLRRNSLGASDYPGALGLSAGLEPGEEPFYLLADDLLALEQGVAHALDYRALLAQQILYLLARLGEYLVDLLAHRRVA